MTKIISITGPSASGKTALSIGLAKQLGGEIVSCDSMQIYRGLTVGTAAPDAAEMDGIPHWGIGICEPTAMFSAADWVALADGWIADIVSRGKMPVICGGTGLYLDSLMQIQSFTENDRDDILREKLCRIAETEGNEVLHRMLAEIDPDAAKAIHCNNVKRVIRAIEVYQTTGRTKTEIDRIQKKPEKRYDEFRVILEFSDRQVLYDRIDRRVELMLKAGILDEARYLRDYAAAHPGNTLGTAWQAIGYKEFFPYFDGLCSLEEAAAQVQQASRQYAKRQITWFRRSDGYRLTPDRPDGSMRSGREMLEEVLAAAAEWLRS
ncbi:MAG: tRNA (adenosine(37)-N6)-dimethylallyltransferase MiaA [Clostridia bacterium]|nr:tRNA (adenosine(37)-N6)-dimethylallyltransferase MiaA [Clostridia bacterium]